MTLLPGSALALAEIVGEGAGLNKVRWAAVTWGRRASSSQKGRKANSDSCKPSGESGLALASCNPCSSSLLALLWNPSSGYPQSFRALGVWVGMCVWRGSTTSAVTSASPRNPTSGSVALRSTVRPTACRLTIVERMPPNLLAIFPNPSVSHCSDLRLLPKAGYKATAVMCSQADMTHESRPSDYMASSLQSHSKI